MKTEEEIVIVAEMMIVIVVYVEEINSNNINIYKPYRSRSF